ncbi:MAG TPA: basic amino acid ABC transporter substrate-binding protein [Methanospirillum sp.]|nr:basic amino acid ABC transporter substrate-binding protein [Methanospirillum sp.]HOL41618.1 basic amino acid ABC transporter substrate-binding protein [Methanospirillum sp.]HPP76699.1 basic amino acid ABC transporter substrate-binding protein [Methanospirillum sp.]
MDKKVVSVVLAFFVLIGVCLCGCTEKPTGETPAISSETNTSEPVSSDRPTYIVGIDGEYPPYSFIDKNGEPQGFDVESVRWIADEMGFQVKIQPMAWDGIIPALQAGKIDMVYSGMTITDERKEVVNFSIPYWKVNQSVAVHDDSNLTMEDFKAGAGKVGAQRGTTGAFWVEENLVNKSILSPDMLVTYDNFPLVATDLQNKRIDFAIYDRPPMLDAIAGKPLHIIGEIDTGEEYGIAIRKSDTELLQTMNEGLVRLMASPKWAELKQKYEME